MFELLSITLKNFGIDYICYFILSPALPNEDNPFLHVFGNFPNEWADYYFEKKFYEIDPIIKYARTAKDPFHWFKLHKIIKLSQIEKNYLDELYAARFIDGITVPVNEALGQTAIFGFSANNKIMNLSDDDIEELNHICFYIHERYCKLTVTHFDEKPILSERELEVLFWVAQGKSDSVIADILSLSEHTIDTYMRRIYKKLNVSNRITACVRAVCLGLLMPHTV
jgi:LuxR family transcriptional regulator/LuxR family quorum-sensing system transcriptional regulator CciR